MATALDRGCSPPAKKCFTMPSWRSPPTVQSCLLLACVLAFTASAQTTTPAAASSFCGVVDSLLPSSSSDTLGVNCQCSEVSFGFKLACTATAQIKFLTEKTTDVVLSYNFQPCASTAEMGYSAIATITPYTLLGTSKTISATLAKEELKAGQTKLIPIPDASFTAPKPVSIDIGLYLQSKLSGNLQALDLDLGITVCAGAGSASASQCPPQAVKDVPALGSIFPLSVLKQTFNFDDACKAACGGKAHCGGSGGSSLNTYDDVGIAVGCAAGLGLVGLGIHRARKKRRQDDGDDDHDHDNDYASLNDDV